MRLEGMDHDVHFGSVGSKPPQPAEDTEDPDDQEMDETPEDVVSILGFDPAEDDDDD